MARCFCPCHTSPGVYPPPCSVCGHDTREGHMVGGHRDGWEPTRLDAGPQPDEMVKLQQALDATEEEVARLQMVRDAAERRNTRLLLAGEHMAAMIRNAYSYANPHCEGPCDDDPCRLFRAARQWGRAVNG